MININKNLKCLVLFGSHARGDIDSQSDFDLLGIDDSKDYSVRDVGKVNFSLYSSSEIIKMSEDGNLFILHIIKEGKCLFNDDFFDILKSSFTYRDSYEEDAIVAYFLATKIYQNKDKITNWPLANKRISWCVRTILISISADNKKPVFSKLALAEIAFQHKYNTLESHKLIDAKSNTQKDEKVLQLLSDFIFEYKYLSNKMNKGILYSRGIVASTINTIMNTTPVFYD